MTKTLLSILFYLSLLMSAAAQTRMFVPNGCGVKTNEMGKDRYVFDPSSEAVQLIKIIMDANFLKSNFEIKASDVQNAIATVNHGKRFIIYNTLFIEQIQNNSGSEGAALYVFAHEIAHHLNNHFFDLNDPIQQKEQELEADLFAGAMMYRLGYSMEEAKSGVDIVCNEWESDTHPPRSARVAAVTSGWKKAREQSNNVQPKRVSLRSVGNTARPPDIPDNMVLIEGGTFQMGSNDGDDDEKPVRAVTISPFYISKFEVTAAEFREFIRSSDYQPDSRIQGNSYGFEDNSWKLIRGLNWSHDPEGNSSYENYPVVNVSWNDAVAYCNWFSEKTGLSYRLPTEAEWEYAAGNSSKHTKYSWGNNEPTEKNGGNVADETFKKRFSDWATVSGYADHYVFLAPVGSYEANELGLFDMSGNVWEWCNDWYENYYGNKLKDPKGPKANASGPVIRGGSWLYVPKSCRVANRLHEASFFTSSEIGFRLAMTP